MAVLRVDDFGGIAPGIDPRNLPDGMAVLAQDCDLHGKSLKPSPTAGYKRSDGQHVDSVPNGEIRGQPSHGTGFVVLPGPSGKAYLWVKNDNVAHQAPGTVNTGDTRWEFYTNSYILSNFHGLRGVHYPAAGADATAVDVAVHLPTRPTVLSATPHGTSSGNDVTYSVVIVSCRTIGNLAVESAPSDAKVVTTNKPALFLDTTDSPDGECLAYISTGGAYRRARAYTGDDVPDGFELAVFLTEPTSIPLTSAGWDSPPSALYSLASTPFGSLMGCTRNFVHFSEPHQPYAWPPAYDVTLPSDVLDTVNAGGMLAAVTGENAYIFQGGHPDSLAVQASLSEKGGMAHGLARTYMGEVFYPCPEGLAVVGQGGAARVLTQDIMDPLTWRGLDWGNAKAALVDGAYYLFNSKATRAWAGGADSAKFGAKFDLLTGKVSVVAGDLDYIAYDARQDRLFYRNAGTIRDYRGGSGRKTAKWRSKEWFFERPVSLACARVELADPPQDSDSVTLRVYKDCDTSVVFHTQDCTRKRNQPFRLPVGRGCSWQFEIETNVEVVSVTLASSMGGLRNA